MNLRELFTSHLMLIWQKPLQYINSSNFIKSSGTQGEYPKNRSGGIDTFSSIGGAKNYSAKSVSVSNLKLETKIVKNPAVQLALICN